MSAPRRIDLRGDPDVDLAPVVAHLRAGGVLAYPTETVYGLGGPVTPEGVARVRSLKGREEGKPLLILVARPDDVAGLRWTSSARALAEAFWPGALTLVLEDREGAFPPGVRSAQGGVGVRVSPHPIVARLLAAWGGPLTSTSLNLPGKAPARSGSEAMQVARQMGDDILVLDGGTLPPSQPSSVVDCTGPAPLVLRRGSIPTDRLRCALPEIDERAED